MKLIKKFIFVFFSYFPSFKIITVAWVFLTFFTMSSSQSFLRNKQLLEKPLNWCIFATAKNTLQVIKKWQYFIKDVCQETVYILLEEILFCCISTTTMTNMVWNILQNSCRRVTWLPKKYIQRLELKLMLNLIAETNLCL